MRTSFGIVSLGIVAAAAATACSGASAGHDKGQAAAAPGATPVAMGDRDMIVLLRDPLSGLGASRSTLRQRAAAIAAAHAPLIAELQALKPRPVRSFEVVNGFAARLSQAESEKFAAKPQVLAVVPDRILSLPRRARRQPGVGQLDSVAGGGAGDPSALCNTLEPEALQLTHAAFVDPSVPQAQTVLDGNGQMVTGQGVTVGIIADGLDPTIAGFVRPDGTNVFVDYQDFSGDPAGTPTGAAEMFGDASSIAAQDMPHGQALTFDISQWGGAVPLPSPCNIRIRGMAPGASLVGLKAFSNLGYSATSAFVQAIDWAVVHDHVDVLNESFGEMIVPDDDTDPISLANAAAVQAGVTVTVATGDGGSAGTLATPATDPNVIAAGASTQFRLYAQTGLLPFATGYVSGNMASFSSGGLAESRPRTVDVVAPGDLGWALCSPSSLYTECWGFPYLVFGGTSEAAPLTAGASALVIQAYRSTHGGQSPSPALVKSILQSTASDLGAPSDEQGAGIIDALAAVNEALAVRDAAGASRRRAARACWRRPTPSRSRRGRATRCRAPSSSRTPARPRWTCSRRSSSSARRSPGRRFRWR